MTRQFYKVPINAKGQEYWVPIVIKNRDTLVGYLEGVMAAGINYDVPIGELMEFLSSDRFNDVCRTGKRLSSMTKTEKFNYYKNMVKDAHEKIVHPEQDESNVLNDYEFGISCKCGNFYGFHYVSDIPEESLTCQVCNQYVIQYINVDDDIYDFDGVPPDSDEMVLMMEKIHQELGLSNSNQENEEDDDDEY